MEAVHRDVEGMIKRGKLEVVVVVVVVVDDDDRTRASGDDMLSTSEWAGWTGSRTKSEWPVVGTTHGYEQGGKRQQRYGCSGGEVDASSLDDLEVVAEHDADALPKVRTPAGTRALVIVGRDAAVVERQARTAGDGLDRDRELRVVVGGPVLEAPLLYDGLVGHHLGVGAGDRVVEERERGAVLGRHVGGALRVDRHTSAVGQALEDVTRRRGELDHALVRLGRDAATRCRGRRRRRRALGWSSGGGSGRSGGGGGGRSGGSLFCR